MFWFHQQKILAICVVQMAIWYFTVFLTQVLKKEHVLENTVEGKTYSALANNVA